MFKLRQTPGKMFFVMDDTDIIARVKLGNIKGREEKEVANVVFEALNKLFNDDCKENDNLN